MFQDRIVLFVTCLAASLAMTACGGPADAPAAQEPPAPVLQGTQLQFAPGHPQLARLGLATVEEARPIVIDMPARLVWNEDRTQRVQPAFAGRIERILVDVGQSVRPGTPLARLASPDFGTAQADAAKARADLSLAQKNLQRLRELHEAGVAARKDLEQAEADAARTQAEVARAQARTSLYGSATGVNQQLGLRSDIRGVVVERNLNPGQEVRPDSSGAPMFVVSDPGTLWVQIDAHEADVADLRPGARVNLMVPTLPDQKLEATISAVTDQIDPNTRTIKVRATVANPQRLLKSEMLATVLYQRQVGNSIEVPASAVFLRGTQHYVFVQTEPGVFEPRDVKVVYDGPRKVLLSEGLKEGEHIVSQNGLLLSRELRIAQDNAEAVQTAAKQGKK